MLSSLLQRRCSTLRFPLARQGLRHWSMTHPTLFSSPPGGTVKWNKLKESSSPYLLQHAANPVDWLPWGPEAFAKSKEKDLPIFLSVGYSTCHWCHVMEKESFEDDEVADYLNQNFIPVKVDREERPDIDRIYMRFVQASTNHGGWPMSVWLTPDLKPIFGGTYFPHPAKYGTFGFLDLIQRITHVWQTDKQKCITSSEHAAQAIQNLSFIAKDDNPDSSDAEENDFFAAEGRRHEDAFDMEFRNDTLNIFFNYLNQRFDQVHGGFGGAPKFPRPVDLTALGACAKHGFPDAQHMIEFTLTQMAKGGIHDHVGGGFHRYSVDRTWHVPHFEKMLYDQAQLVMSYLQAYKYEKNALFLKTLTDTLEYVRRVMWAKESGGGFYSAEDADSQPIRSDPEKKEGAFYVYHMSTLQIVLNEEDLPIFCFFFGIQENGNCPPGSDPHGELTDQNILIQKATIAETAKKFDLSEEDVVNKLEQMKSKIFDFREKTNIRPRPGLDYKILTSWNGLMISAFARASTITQGPLPQESYLSIASEVAKFIKNNLYSVQEKKLLRMYTAESGASPIHGFLEDYAFLIGGLLDIYEAGGNYEFLKFAIELQNSQDKFFYDQKAGGYYSTESDQEDVIARLKDSYDGAEPCGTSWSVMNLLRLYSLTKNENFLPKAEKSLKLFKTSFTRTPFAVPHLVAALDVYFTSPTQILLAGNLDDPALIEMKYEIMMKARDSSVCLLYCDGAEGQKYLREELGLSHVLETNMMIDNKPTMYLCRNFSCQAPTNDLQQVIQLLKDL